MGSSVSPHVCQVGILLPWSEAGLRASPLQPCFGLVGKMEQCGAVCTQEKGDLHGCSVGGHHRPVPEGLCVEQLVQRGRSLTLPGASLLRAANATKEDCESPVGSAAGRLPPGPPCRPAAPSPGEALKLSPPGQRSRGPRARVPCTTGALRGVRGARTCRGLPEQGQAVPMTLSCDF